LSGSGVCATVVVVGGDRVERIRVGVVDEYEIFRRGVVACLREDPHLLVVVDLPVGPVSIPLDVAVVSNRAANEERFGCPVVVCSAGPSAGSHVGAGNTSMAFLPRSTLTPVQLIVTVRAVAAGLRVDVSASAERESDRRLDQRRAEVLRLLAEGASTREIGESLRYSDRTIKALIQDIERELGAKSRAQAVAEAIRKGLIPAVLIIMAQDASFLAR
jgi:DNA-binding NarL/FixJ family response regulator